MYHHSSELIEAVKEKDGTESVYLVGVLLTHVGYIQSANPVWLKAAVGKQIEILEQGIKTKDQDATRDSAEMIHTSSNKIVLSSGLQKDLYIHSRWMKDIRELNGWGDEIIGQVNSGDWAGPAVNLPKIKVAYRKWVKSFKK